MPKINKDIIISFMIKYKSFFTSPKKVYFLKLHLILFNIHLLYDLCLCVFSYIFHFYHVMAIKTAAFRCTLKAISVTFAIFFQTVAFLACTAPICNRYRQLLCSVRTILVILAEFASTHYSTIYTF